MLSFVSGIVVAGAGIAGFWYAKPQNGEVRWYIEAPVLEWMIPIALVGTVAVGLGLMLSGISG
jgi:hypothetical protein